MFKVLSDHICISALDLNITNSKLFNYAAYQSSKIFAMRLPCGGCCCCTMVNTLSFGSPWKVLRALPWKVHGNNIYIEVNNASKWTITMWLASVVRQFVEENERPL